MCSWMRSWLIEKFAFMPFTVHGLLLCSSSLVDSPLCPWLVLDRKQLCSIGCLLLRRQCCLSISGLIILQRHRQPKDLGWMYPICYIYIYMSVYIYIPIACDSILPKSILVWSTCRLIWCYLSFGPKLFLQKQIRFRKSLRVCNKAFVCSEWANFSRWNTLTAKSQ